MIASCDKLLPRLARFLKFRFLKFRFLKIRSKLLRLRDFILSMLGRFFFFFFLFMRRLLFGNFASTRSAITWRSDSHFVSWSSIVFVRSNFHCTILFVFPLCSDALLYFYGVYYSRSRLCISHRQSAINWRSCSHFVCWNSIDSHSKLLLGISRNDLFTSANRADSFHSYLVCIFAARIYRASLTPRFERAPLMDPKVLVPDTE